MPIINELQTLIITIDWCQYHHFVRLKDLMSEAHLEEWRPENPEELPCREHRTSNFYYIYYCWTYSLCTKNTPLCHSMTHTHTHKHDSIRKAGNRGRRALARHIQTGGSYRLGTVQPLIGCQQCSQTPRARTSPTLKLGAWDGEHLHARTHMKALIFLRMWACALSSLGVCACARSRFLGPRCCVRASGMHRHSNIS